MFSWKKAYQDELNAFNTSGDIGEIWFGESSERRMVKWLKENHSNLFDSPVLEIGCGNGHLCLLLAKAGFTNVLGVDYIPDAVALSERIADAELKEIPPIRQRVRFRVADFLTENDAIPQGSCFGVIVDKGTYDAISLCPDDAVTKRKAYLRRLSDVLEDERGIFVITSCNWTRAELTDQLAEYGFIVRDVIPTPEMKFGGSVGNNVTSLVFSRNKRAVAAS